MHSAKSSNGRIEWMVDNKGQLTETGPSAPKFTMSAVDTLTLATLLLVEIENIKAAAEFEKFGVRKPKPREIPYEGDKDFVEGVEVDG